MTARIAAYLTVAVVCIVAVVSWQEREDGRLEERERLAVAHAQRWHTAYVAKRDSARKLEVVARQAVARSHAMRDSVRVLNDSLVAVTTPFRPDTTLFRVDTVRVPQIVVRRLVADSVTIARLTALADVQQMALYAAESAVTGYKSALVAAQQAGRCRIAKVIPCPSRKTTALLTAGTLWVVKLAIGGI